MGRIAALLALLLTGAAQAAEPDFGLWLDGLRGQARAAGISEPTLAAALDGVTPIDRVIELDRKQPEGGGGATLAGYLKRVMAGDRLIRGRQMADEHARLLARVAHDYHVPAHYILALWGMETSYGRNMGGFRTIDALATLAWEGRRADFFRAELLKALQILDEGHISAEAMKGSWAGAMGQSQFMPSSFLNFAVDGDGDGRRDIWDSKADVFASAANYLSRSGWKEDETWGREVRLPKGLKRGLIGMDTRHELDFWRRQGLRRADGGKLPVVAGMMASLVQPDGPGGRAFLVYDNFRVLMKWNRSVYFGISVGLLADQLR